MAAKYRKIDPRIWTDEKFRTLTTDGRFLTFWLLSSSRVNRCGIVLWSPGLASEETGIPINRIDTVLDTVCNTLYWVRDTVSRMVFLTHWWRYNRPDNIKALQGALSDLHDVPSHSLKSALIDAVHDLPASMHTSYIHTIDTVCDTVCDTVSPQEQEQEQEQEGGTTPPRPPKWSAPTLEEVRAYCIERGNAVDPQKFIDHYTANGWRVGRNPMKDWKAAVRTWERNEFSANGTSHTAPKTKAQLHQEAIEKNRRVRERIQPPPPEEPVL